jgi:uncharacterized membrane protein YhaH (DUF805 family)
MSIGNSPAMMMILGVFILLMGLAMIVSHNIWHGWPILITVIGYLITIKGVAFLFFPQFLGALIPYWRQNNLFISAIPTFIIAIVLLYFGFFHNEEKYN